MYTGVFSDTPVDYSKGSTHLSDVNETMITYFLCGEKWIDSYTKSGFHNKISLFTKSQYEEIKEQSYVMANEFSDWSKNNYNNKKIISAHWCARPGILKEITKKDVDARDNPSDVLAVYEDDSYLGISAKYKTKGKNHTLKSVGRKTIDEYLSIGIDSFISEKQTKILKELDLHKLSQKDRKHMIRSNLSLKTETQKQGIKLLEEINFFYLDHMKHISQREKKIFLENCILNSTSDVPYVKVIGYNSDKVHISDPKSLTENKYISFNPSPISKTSHKIESDGERICNMMWRFKSEKLASTPELRAEE